MLQSGVVTCCQSVWWAAGKWCVLRAQCASAILMVSLVRVILNSAYEGGQCRRESGVEGASNDAGRVCIGASTSLPCFCGLQSTELQRCDQEVESTAWPCKCDI